MLLGFTRIVKSCGAMPGKDLVLANVSGTFVT